MIEFKENSGINIREFPSTRYQGSKRKILPWIYENVMDLEFDTVLDAFGGSASVSYLFKKMNKEVTYNDKLRFNYLIGKALIENSDTLFEKEDVKRLLTKQETIEYHKIIQKNFEGIYYLDAENKWLDQITSNIVQMNHYTDVTLERKKALAFYAVFQACLIKRPFNLFHRNNLNLRTNEQVVRNFGNKTTWDRPFNKYLKQFVEEANKLVFDNGRFCKSVNESAFEIDPYGYDLVYLDPPYITKKKNLESSDYMRCYHFLEGLADYTNWEENIDKTTINRRLKNIALQRDFENDSVLESFEELISRFQNSTIVLSYKVGGVPSISYLSKLIKKIKGNVHIATRHYKYALNHQNGDAKKNREVLIIGV